MSEKEFMDKIASMIREQYPDAVSVNIFVNYQGIDIDKKYRKKVEGASYKTLSGEWVKE